MIICLCTPLVSTLLAGALNTILNLLLHPFHVSVCEIQYNPKSKHIEIYQQIFIDDLETGLQYHCHKPYLDIMDTHQNNHLDSLINNYYRQHLVLQVNATSIQWIYLGYDIKEPHIFIYADAPLTAPPRQIKVQQTLLIDHIPEQTNLVHIKSTTRWHSFRLDRQKISTPWVQW